MISPRVLVPLAFVSALVVAPAARAQGATPDTVAYSLSSPPSEFEYGCFAPCVCALTIRAPLTGTFLLRRARIDPLYTYYDVLDVRWKVPEATHNTTITGVGVYRRGGEFAAMEQLTLDLSFDGGPLQHFDSGLHPPRAPFPDIETDVSLHGEYCQDSVLVIGAKPLGPVGVGDGGLGPKLAATPNPFRASTEIDFALAQAGDVSLGVYDLGGRRVRVLIDHRWVATGAQKLSWDGRLDDGTAAPAGLYFVRLERPTGVSTRTVVKLQ